jgi:D-alanyl-D-alanine carboxypeptidase
MYRIVLIIFIIFLALSGLQAQHKTQEIIDGYFQEMLKEADIHNGFLQISSPDGNINWSFAGGSFQDGNPVSESNPFHSTSVGKMFTATAIMQLVEDGKLNLNDSIPLHLPAEVIEGLHVMDGKDYSTNITIAQLLQHTSGLPDYIMDTPKDGSPNMLTLTIQNPDKFWEVDEFLAFCREKLEARFLPGQGYYYTDTEYVLLGLIIQEKYQKPLQQVFLEKIFKPLRMKHTAMYKRSEPMKRTGKMAEFYLDQMEISQYQSLSIDWAGGGLATTTEDLFKFHQALFSGELISENTLGQMQNWIKESHGIYYGLGLRKYDFRELSQQLPELTIIGHSGTSSAFSFYCPELDVYAAGTFNQSNQMEKAIGFVAKVLAALQNDL